MARVVLLCTVGALLLCPEDAAAITFNGTCSGSEVTCPTDGAEVDSCSEECSAYPVTDEDAGECIDRKVFGATHRARDIVAFVVWFLGAGMAMGAGVGGGGIFVPLGILLLGFQTKVATGLSQASIFGASTGGLIVNMRNRHPLANRPIIDLDMALFLSPMEMAGAVVGVLVQKALPEWVVILLMAVILGVTGVKTLRKGFDVRKKDAAAKEKTQAAAGDAPAQSEPAEGRPPPPVESVEVAMSDKGDNADGKEVESVGPSPATASPMVDAPAAAVDLSKVKGKEYSVQEWLDKDAATPYKKYAYLALLWCALFLLQVFKGGKGLKSALGEDVVPNCGAVYWLLLAAQFVWLFGFGAIMGRRLVNKGLRRQAAGVPMVQGDPTWDYAKCFFYAKWTFVAGIVAGLIGIGGGMVLGPLMLQMNILPQVSTATTATMVVLTSSSVAIMYITSGQVPIDYALTFMAVAFCGAVLGKSQLDKYVKKHNATYVLVFILATIILFASSVVLIAGGVKYSKRDWCFEGFNALC
eukprot:TRINITY_DN8685_c0_g3_i2.p1 TRINITY_DN8685_c0_g3~~TRINITY_DN8685_c0_g3_i2.p1  ORF type:complete len:526 (+),score=203.00 TRINITY_DN8685_c0_g3_i2:69-1646(+)